MSNTTSTFLGKYGDWVFRVLMLLGIGVNLWLTNNFVTRQEYDTNVAQIKTTLADETKNIKSEFSLFVKENATVHLMLQTSISDIATSLKLMAASQLRIDDHESRIRVVERNQVDVMSRLSAVERNFGSTHGSTIIPKTTSTTPTTN